MIKGVLFGYTVFFVTRIRSFGIHLFGIMLYPCIFPLKVQATQWKNWGNELHKEGKYEMMAEYYSLALDFTPESNSEITTALLSNRCLALINLEKFKEALEDADRCTKLRPKWFRVSWDLCHWLSFEGWGSMYSVVLSKFFLQKCVSVCNNVKRYYE